jgi:type IV secretory pathway VirD2 relaxase
MARTVKLSIYEPATGKPNDLLRQKSVYKKEDMREYRRLCRELSNLLFSNTTGKRPRTLYGSRSALSSQQQCIVKCRKGKDITAHQRFIKEYLPQESKSRVKEKPELFNTETVGEDYLDQYTRAMTGRHFKFIISPESPRVDIKALVKTLVKRMEKTTGYSFYWMAAVHTDTDHPHAHLLLNGTDKTGREEEIRAALSQSHKSYRYCHIDESIRLYETALKQKDEVYGTQIRARDDITQNRLVFLSSLGLAKKAKDKKKLFYLEKDWQKKLKAMGRYNSFLKARSELSLSLPYQMELYSREAGEVSGKITRLYRMNDEENWSS